MPTLADRIQGISDLVKPEAEHLRALCSSWQVLADLSFSDLMLYVRVRDAETFQICAQLRPLTAQTLYPQDMVGVTVTQPEQPIVERAFREGRIWAQDDPVLLDGIPIRMDAVPVRFDGRVVAVVTKEGSPATSRRPGRLEQVYLQAAEVVSQMVCDGVFPFPDMPSGDWPRVGEGLYTVDPSGRIVWASPNALSSLHRLGVRHNVLGRRFDELGVGETPVARTLETRRPLDGELVRGEAHVRMRVMPLLDGTEIRGGLVLTRDVTELRQRDRVISVKDATIREIHHRVKNNLQTIASLLHLQARRLHSEEAKAALQESVLRVRSIALVHEFLSEQPSEVADFSDVARRIARMVSEGLVEPGRGVEIKVTGGTGMLGADVATPLAVSVTELMQNAVEHAFPDGRSGTIGVQMAHNGESINVVVWDDGVGLPEGSLHGQRLGLQIVRSLVEELGGTFRMSSAGGTRAQIVLPASRG